jgi:hypothetical protein
MGSSFGIKVLNLTEHHILKGITFNNRKFVEYIYYITKINRFHIENVKKNMIMNEFTITNIITKKDFSIMIERVEIGYFLEGMKYKCEVMPNLEKMIMITNVLEGSLGELVSLVPNETIVVGTEVVFFDSLVDIEKMITEKKADFMFYNLSQEKIFRVDFEGYRKDDGELRLGFECEEMKIEDLAKLIEQKNELTRVIGLFEFDVSPINKEQTVVPNEVKIESTATYNEEVKMKVESDTMFKDEMKELMLNVNPFDVVKQIDTVRVKNPFDNDDEQLIIGQKDIVKKIENTDINNEQTINSDGCSNDSLIEYLVTGYYLTSTETYTTSHTILKISDLDKNTINVN